MIPHAKSELDPKRNCEYIRQYWVRLDPDGSPEHHDGAPILYRDSRIANKNIPDKYIVVAATLIYRAPVRRGHG